MNLAIKIILEKVDLDASQETCREVEKKLISLKTSIIHKNIEKYWKIEECYEINIISSIEESQNKENLIKEVKEFIGENWIEKFSSSFLEPSAGGKPFLANLRWASVELIS